MAPSGYGDNRFLGLEPFGRYSHEMSVTAGMLCIFGIINLVPGVYDLCLSTTDGQDWSGDSDDYPPVVVHLAALIQILFSIVSISVGFQYMVCGAMDSKWTMLSLLCSFFSLFPFAVAISHIGFLSAERTYDFIPVGFNPSKSETRSVASLIALGYIAYAANNFLALVYLNFKMFKYSCGEWTGFNRGFYKKALMIFGFFTMLAGVVQLALGVYVYDKVEDDLVRPPLGFGLTSGPFFVTYSRMAIAVGSFQFILGCCIIVCAAQKPCGGSGENAVGLKTFQSAAWLVLLLGISTQVLSQVTTSSTALTDDYALAGYATQATAYVVGLGLFPIYLDGMYYTTPETIERHDFSSNATDFTSGNKDFSSEERKVESATDKTPGGDAPVVAGTV
ncbi:unnamed protein product [Scytosiphon promiscuus]